MQVQSWPARERNLALYENYPGPDGPIEFDRTTLRGVPGAIFEDGRRIEVYTAATTIVVFAQDRRLARAAALQLTGIENGQAVRATDDLPPPDQGALTGAALLRFGAGGHARGRLGPRELRR